MRFTATLTGGSIPLPDEHWSTPMTIKPSPLPAYAVEAAHEGSRELRVRALDMHYATRAISAQAAYEESVVYDLLCRWVSELKPEIVRQHNKIIGLAAAGHGVVSVWRNGF